MNKFKLVATDIDDTILPSGHKDFSLETKKMFADLKKANIITAFVTGRDLVTIGNLIKSDSIDYFIGGNGCFIYSFLEQKIIYERILKNNDLKKIIEFFLDRDTKFIVADKNFIYYSSNYDVQNSKFLKDHLHMVKTIYEFDYSSEVHIVTVIDQERNESEVQRSFVDFINQNQLDAHISSRWSWGFFIVPKGVNKYNTLFKLAEMHNISNEEIIAFGDSQNDIDMIANVGYGVAMGNGLKEVKAVAKAIAEPAIENGVYKKIKELQIIK